MVQRMERGVAARLTVAVQGTCDRTRTRLLSSSLGRPMHGHLISLISGTDNEKRLEYKTVGARVPAESGIALDRSRSCWTRHTYCTEKRSAAGEFTRVRDQCLAIHLPLELECKIKVI